MEIRVITSWDDGAEDDLHLAELLIKYDIQAIFYWPSDWQTYNKQEGRTPLTTEQAINISKRFEVGAHGVTHRLLTRIPFNEAIWEIRESKTQLEELFDIEIDSFCYPRGYANDELRDEVRKYYKTARNTLVGSIKEGDDPVWQTTSVHVGGKRRQEYEHTTWLDEAYKLLDEAIKTEDSVYHMWGHSWEISRYDGWHDLEQLLKKVSDADTHS